MMSMTRLCSPLGLLLLPLLASAQTMLEPGDVTMIMSADDCVASAPAMGFGGAAEARCDAGMQTLGARSTVGPAEGETGTLSGLATLWVDVQVTSSAETMGNVVPAFFSFNVLWKGLLDRLDENADAMVSLSYAITNETQGTTVKKGLIWARSTNGFVSGGAMPAPGLPAVDEGAVNEVVAIGLARGDVYRFGVELACDATVAGTTEGATCDYFDDMQAYGAALRSLQVAVGADNAEFADRLMRLEEDVEQLQGDVEGIEEDLEAIEERLDQVEEDVEALLGHSHDYLTGRGVGHNNTDATTSLPNLDGDDEPVVEPHGPPAPPASNGNGNKNGHDKGNKSSFRWPWSLLWSF